MRRDDIEGTVYCGNSTFWVEALRDWNSEIRPFRFRFLLDESDAF